jgi:tRNA nucleotidyltransferase (CCA-adding enzyme)
MTLTAALRAAVAPPVIELCHRLHERGFRGWVVGGSVRDVLLAQLGRQPVKPYDWDVATSATPTQVVETFRRVIPTGIAHGTVTVMMGKLGIEVTTLRGESTYSDGRHPDRVTFVDDIEADLARRDFTVNAIAFDPIDATLIDPFDGLGDLQRRLLRAVGDPASRFGEDGLRVLRAARFAATLDFDIEPATRAAIRPSLDSYRKVSAERVRDEWLKAMSAKRPSRAFEIMLEEGLLDISAKELALMAGCEQNRYHRYDVFTHTMRVLDNVESSRRTLRIAALLHDIGKPATRARSEATGDYTFYQHEIVGAKMADALMRRLRFSNEEREEACQLVRNHLVVYEPSWTDAAVRRWITRVGLERRNDVLALARADILGKGRDVTDELRTIDELSTRVEALIAAGAAFGIRDLAIAGNDLIEHLKITPGPLVGRLLRQLLERVLENPEQNQRERLLAEARTLFERDQAGPHSPSDAGSP